MGGGERVKGREGYSDWFVMFNAQSTERDHLGTTEGERRGGEEG